MELSRHTIRLVVEFKKHLDRLGIPITLNSRNTPLELLNVSSGIADERVQHYREQLVQALPPVQRISVMDDDQEPPACAKCGRSVDSREHLAPSYINCRCGQVLRLVSGEERAHPHYPICLPGVYLTSQGNARLVEMVVEDVSYGGVRLRTQAPHGIAPEDRLRICFNLDDADQTLIRQPIYVCDVKEHLIGGQFVEPSHLDHALMLYLGTKWIKAKPA